MRRRRNRKLANRKKKVSYIFRQEGNESLSHGFHLFLGTLNINSKDEGEN
jgi:hypothetical protein